MAALRMQTAAEYYSRREFLRREFDRVFGDLVDLDAPLPISVYRARLDALDRQAGISTSTTTTTSGPVVLDVKRATFRGRPCDESHVRMTDGRVVLERIFLDRAQQYERNQK